MRTHLYAGELIIGGIQFATNGFLAKGAGWERRMVAQYQIFMVR